MTPEDLRTADAFRIEAENLAFRMGHLTCTAERIASQADELRMRRELAWARACCGETQWPSRPMRGT